jgi:hypothetical protein
MVGEGVLHVCLNSPEVESVLIVNRRPYKFRHEKLKEIIHRDFLDLSPIADHLMGYNACFFCAGVTSIGKKENEYSSLTYDLTLHCAKTVLDKNPNMVFCYVSGSGTDSTEKGRSMWARVKGRTENALLGLGFKDAYMFRPGYMQPIKGLKNTYRVYKFLAPLYPFWKLIIPSFVNTLHEVGKAMINVVIYGNEKKILECKDITKVAHIKAILQ